MVMYVHMWESFFYILKVYIDYIDLLQGPILNFVDRTFLLQPFLCGVDIGNQIVDTVDTALDSDMSGQCNSVVCSITILYTFDTFFRQR